MLVSTFELLVKPILPKELGSPPAARTILQGYFLTISNVNPVSTAPVELYLQFTAVPSLNNDDIVTFFDVDGTQPPTDPLPAVGTGKPSRKLTIPAGETGLFILQPDIITNPDLLTKADFEARGYVEVFLSPESPTSSAELLVTPEHRGTFFPKESRPPIARLIGPDFDQLAYSLPTANGGAYLKLEHLQYSAA